ncbi:MAG: hypothetical protein ACK5V3_06800, partial [Bdellovibrionales bacterium]
ARQLEKAHAYLSRFFITMPQGRIPIVLNDSTDLANGFATRVPYPYSMLFPVLPDLNDSLSEPAEWSLELATHELAHILSFEPATGVMHSLRNVFGTVVAPNLLLPNWWKEGLSVWTETAIGNGGRLRSNYQNASLRSWIGEKDLQDESVAMANENLPIWPWGSRPYLFGSLAMSYLINEFGEEKSSQLIERHGERVPYFLSGATRSIVKKDYEDIYNEALDFWQTRAQNQVTELEKTKFDSPAEIQTGDINVRSPTLNARENLLAWVGHSKLPQSHLQLAQLNEKKELIKVTTIFKQRAIREARFFPKSDTLLINAVMPASATEHYGDFYVYHVKRKKLERLTKKLRGREGRVSLDETQFIFVGVQGGRTELKSYHFKSKTVKSLVTSNFDERIASPLFLNDSLILFSWLKKGAESLYTFDLKSNELKLLPQFGNRMRRPAWDGKNLYFLSDKNGTFNLYQSSLENRDQPEALTHSKTLILDYACSPSGALFTTQLTRQGPRLFYSGSVQPKSSLPVISNDDLTYGKNKNADLPLLSDSEIKEADRTYKLWPHYWVPFYSGSSARDGALISLSTTGQDPSLQHNYSLEALYDTGTQDFSYGMSYTNLTQSFPWVLQSSRIVRSFAGTESTYSNQVHAVTVAPDTSAWTDFFSSQFSFLYAKYEDDFKNYERFGPQFALNYNSAEQTIWMISPENGHTLQFSGIHFLKSADLESYNQFRARGATYLSRWLPERHAFAIDTKFLATDRRIPSILGEASTYFMNELTSNFLIRGYFEGQFIGRNMVNANLEYRFPIVEGHKGWGLFPLYIKRIHGALAADFLTLDGFAYQEKTRSEILVDRDQLFSSAGAELRVDTTVGYILPLQVVVGLHQPLQSEYRELPNALVQVRTSLSF